MTTPTYEAIALATAARIAHALGEQWARCPGCVPTSFSKCTCPRGHAGRHVDRSGNDWMDGTDWAPIVHPLTTLAEAKAEWAAAGGDPERGPALSGRSADGRVRWCSNEFGVSVHVGFLTATRRAGSMGWDFGGHGTSACLVELGRLTEAADGGEKCR